MMRAAALALVAVLAAALAVSARAEQCGKQADGALCPNCLCCSEWGYCGSGDNYCGNGCQSQCDGCGGGGGGGGGGEGTISSVLTEELFNTLLKNRNGNGCKAAGFFTYNALITAANAFPDFGTTGSLEVQKREIAAFLGQTGHETTGGWVNAPDGAYTWGYCFKKERQCDPDGGSMEPNVDCNYCDMRPPHDQWPCVSGQQYYGRGPIQLSWNYNYGLAGEHPAIGKDLLSNPELVAQDAILSFKTAIWFWMTPQGKKPSCHDVMTDQWTPSDADVAAGRLPGYGVTTNIINGGIECGKGFNEEAANRTFFYTSYCQILGISPGENLDCYNQGSFDSVFLPPGATTATLEYRADA